MASKYVNEENHVNSEEWREEWSNVIQWFREIDSIIDAAVNSKNTRLQWLGDMFDARLYDARNELENAIEADELLSDKDKQYFLIGIS